MKTRVCIKYYLNDRRYFFNISQDFSVFKAYFLIKMFLMKKKRLSKKTNTIASRSSIQRWSIKRVFLRISKILQENTCARVSFLITLEALAYSVNKNRPWNRWYSVNFAKFSRTRFLQNNSAQPVSYLLHFLILLPITISIYLHIC